MTANPGPKGKASRTAATTREASVSPVKSTRSYNAKQRADKLAEARAWLGRRHRRQDTR